MEYGLALLMKAARRPIRTSTLYEFRCMPPHLLSPYWEVMHWPCKAKGANFGEKLAAHAIAQDELKSILRALEASEAIVRITKAQS